MIDFACKKFDINDIFKCGLGLTKADFKVMEFLIKNHDKEWATDKLSTKLNLNISTVQRAVKKLHEQDIIDRIQKNLISGGYFFVYQSKNKKTISRVLMSVVHKWVSRVEDELKDW